MKHVVLFSRGAQSAYVAVLIAKKYKKEDIILLHTPTHSEHPDADRFGKDISNFLDISITETWSVWGDIWEVAQKTKYIPNNRVRPCTQRLKVLPAQKFYKELQLRNEKFSVYVGYCPGEEKRVEKFKKANPDIDVRFPLIEKNISSEQSKEKIKELGIKLPEAYLYFKHNNCIPCFLGGKKYWKNVLKFFPEAYKKAELLEKQFGHTILRNLSLEELRKG
ncbi:MAG: hypothetical protein U9P90_02180 [Patescibacteria group bacterium]|nr:hypothetical protein [Patescibacteria group bacterium]